ncbi:DUF2304 domain-containing protein [Ruicaihuangia caeni]|uniref:DUF2304 domain-containing protein n=1 Tax=Ruicaihuangia caeni TaxID=3042517 RepID=UPI00338E19AC
MTIIFQVLAAVVIVIAAFFMVRGGGSRHQAIRRILMFLFIIAAGLSVFFPQAWTWVANRLGIGRGADLLLYITVLAFLGFAASTYRWFRRMEADMTELARQLALERAKHPTQERD